MNHQGHCIAITPGVLKKKSISPILSHSVSFYFVFFLLSLLSGTPVLAQDSRLRGFTVSPALNETDYDVLQTWKSNIIRYHLQWDFHADTASSEEYLEWLEGALKELDSVVEWSKSRGIKLIVNLHTPPGGFKSSVYPSLHRMFAEQWALDTFTEAWRRIASRYAGEETIWGYDILNEPAVRATNIAIRPWAVVAQETGALISKIDSKRKIIVEPIYGDQARMSSINKLSFKNLVISIHFYYPLLFHHQGIYGNPLGVSYPTKSFTRATILKNMRTIIKFQERTKNKIPIYVGEFTAVRWAPKNSAYLYLRDVIAIMERMKWNWTYHSFRESDAWNLELDGTYGVTTPVIGESDRERLVRKYLNKNKLPAF